MFQHTFQVGLPLRLKALDPLLIINELILDLQEFVLDFDLRAQIALLRMLKIADHMITEVVNLHNFVFLLILQDVWRRHNALLLDWLALTQTVRDLAPILRNTAVASPQTPIQLLLIEGGQVYRRAQVMRW